MLELAHTVNDRTFTKSGGGGCAQTPAQEATPHFMCSPEITHMRRAGKKGPGKCHDLRYAPTAGDYSGTA